MKATPETKAAAKDAGIKSWHVKSEENLQAELAELTETVDVGDESEPVEVVKETALELPSDVESEVMRFSIKCVGINSPWYKYRKLLGM